MFAFDRRGLGEVVVRSPYLLTEYFKNADATRSTLRQGWLHTGVIGLPHSDWGEQVHAVVEIRRDAEVTKNALID